MKKTAHEIEIEYGLPAGSVSIITEDGITRIDYGTSLAGRKVAKLQELAAARYAEEIAGIDLGGGRINTGRGDQAMINGAGAFVAANPEATIRFKGANGWQDLSAAQIAGIAQAVGQHVQACFAREGELADAVAAAETIEAVEAIEWISPYAY
jgi:hypothetical protein